MILRLVFFSVILFWASIPLAIADGRQEASEHARSAFLFADRKQWSDANLHARRSGDPALERLIEWLTYLDPASGASFAEITSFIANHPKWPEARRLRTRAEQAIYNSNVSDHDLIAWFSDNPPVTGNGKLALAEAQMREGLSDEASRSKLIREGWIHGDFYDAERDRILQQYGALLTRDDHAKRASQLMWEDKVSPALDMLSLLSSDEQKLLKARAALIRRDSHADKAIAQVPDSLRKDQGLLYDRMRYRARQGNDAGVREILLSVKETAPYASKWWDYRERQVREAIDEGNYKLATRLLEHHGLSEGPDYVDASWLHGWLKLEFLNQPSQALPIFEAMYDTVRFPVSKARAAYWAARAADSSGNQNAASRWYERASAYPTAFYGQLASLKAHGQAPLRFPAEPTLTNSELESFSKQELVQAVIIASRLGKDDLASRLLSGMVEHASSKEEAAMMAMIGSKAGEHFLSVRTAKKALQFHNAVLLKAGYPTPKTPSDAAVDRPLLLAITRQESEFDPYAKSPASAMGMMQVLPGTAKETARKNALGYHVSRLYEPDYSWLIGSLYLDRMINHYDGSYILAIASYNAGPGNVRKWVNEFGRPGNDIESAVQWIEKIPFKETRNYVQRVLENLQVYRHLLAENETPKLKLGEDLVR